MTSAARPLTRRRPISERMIETLPLLSAGLGVVTTIGIILVLAVETLGFIGKVVFPAALSGIMASIILAMSRAIGERMAVLLAVGINPSSPLTRPGASRR